MVVLPLIIPSSNTTDKKNAREKPLAKMLKGHSAQKLYINIFPLEVRFIFRRRGVMG